jgi:hypothetical protein
MFVQAVSVAGWSVFLLSLAWPSQIHPPPPPKSVSKVVLHGYITACARNICWKYTEKRENENWFVLSWWIHSPNYPDLATGDILFSKFSSKETELVMFWRFRKIVSIYFTVLLKKRLRVLPTVAESLDEVNWLPIRAFEREIM